MLNDCPIKFVKLHLKNMKAFLKELMVIIACQSCHKPYMMPLSWSFRANSVVDIYKVFSWICFAHMYTIIKHFWIFIV